MPTDHVLLDNILLPAEAAAIPATCEGFLYGHGAFETIKIVGGRAAFLPQHHDRLAATARDLGLPWALPLGELRVRIHRLVAANALHEGAVRLTLFKRGRDAGELIATRALAYPPETYERGFRLKTTFTGERTGAITLHKTLNHLANILARQEARDAGFDEALFLTPAGIVIEGSATNVFSVKKGVVCTPPLASGPLPGTARARVLAHLGPQRARETLLMHSDLLHADALFVTNALMGVMPVTRLDDRAYPVSPLVLDIARACRDLENASLS